MPQENILRDGQIAGEVKFLVNGRDTQGLRVLRAADLNRLALKEDLAFVFGIRARENLDQGGFTGSIFAQQGVYLPFPHGQIDALQRLHAGERLADTLHFEQHFAWSRTHGVLLYGYLPRWVR